MLFDRIYYFFNANHHSKVNHFVVIALKDNSYDILAYIMHISLHSC